MTARPETDFTLLSPSLLELPRDAGRVDTLAPALVSLLLITLGASAGAMLGLSCSCSSSLSSALSVRSNFDMLWDLSNLPLLRRMVAGATAAAFVLVVE